MTPQQYKRMIDDFNRKAKQHNDQLKKNINNYNRSIEDYNREVRRVNTENKRRVDNFNGKVRQFNQTQRQSFNRAIQNFNQFRAVGQNSKIYIYRASVVTLEERYNSLEDYNSVNEVSNSALMADYPAQETYNSVQLYNSIAGIDQGDYLESSKLQLTEVEEKLYDISLELGKRWEGAIFSLNPQNPDASRHFCTSVREIFIQILDIKAPDEKVLQKFPNCDVREGRPTRREKIKYLLSGKLLFSRPIVDFVNADVDDLLELFRTLNDGTHGSAGTFTVQHLLKIKKRAEDSILYLTALSEHNSCC